jgi:2-C-methyl-D-erythritol 4-phosphate cytidylyltransferase/2-C-methyl-D-erythritol 2,4-cyclodiphosphate synthase
MTMRIGSGFDAHRFDPSRPLILAGVEWPDEPGLAGHSDGDAVLHAIVDALLSAAGLGDIGGQFGTSDPAYLNASSEVFVLRTRELLAEAGWRIVNISVQLIGEKPKLAQRRDEVQQHLSELFDAPVSLAATTSDGMGFTGRGEGVAVHATALLTSNDSVASA